ncbi:MAG: DeoR/GlpR transcriptional regulator, partial [Chloroflexota bacterium]
MFAEERRRAILEQLRQHGRVSVPDLAAQLRVSAVTIRSDLSALEETGVLERTYGGAVL